MEDVVPREGLPLFHADDVRSHQLGLDGRSEAAWAASHDGRLQSRLFSIKITMSKMRENCVAIWQAFKQEQKKKERKILFERNECPCGTDRERFRSGIVFVDRIFPSVFDQLE